MNNLLLRNLSLLSYFLLLGLILCEPALANKFETIGGGVQGSTKVKVEYLQVIAYVASGIFFISAYSPSCCITRIPRP